MSIANLSLKYTAFHYMRQDLKLCGSTLTSFAILKHNPGDQQSSLRVDDVDCTCMNEVDCSLEPYPGYGFATEIELTRVPGSGHRKRHVKVVSPRTATEPLALSAAEIGPLARGMTRG